MNFASASDHLPLWQSPSPPEVKLQLGSKLSSHLDRKVQVGKNQIVSYRPVLDTLPECILKTSKKKKKKNVSNADKLDRRNVAFQQTAKERRAKWKGN